MLMLKERVNKIRLLTNICSLSINIINLHIINKTKINNFVDKNIDKKLVMTKKRIIFAAKRKERRIYYF